MYPILTLYDVLIISIHVQIRYNETMYSRQKSSVYRHFVRVGMLYPFKHLFIYNQTRYSCCDASKSIFRATVSIKLKENFTIVIILSKKNCSWIILHDTPFPSSFVNTFSDHLFTALMNEHIKKTRYNSIITVYSKLVKY